MLKLLLIIIINAEKVLLYLYLIYSFWVMSQQRQKSRKVNFGSSNARVSERDLDVAGKVLMYRYSWRNWLTRTADS